MFRCAVAQRNKLHFLLHNTIEYLKGSIGRIDALHLSCHGSSQAQPMLMLDDDVGEQQRINAGDLYNQVLAHATIPLVFLSACQSQKSGDNMALDFASDLILQGVACVMSWADSVLDTSATLFAAAFYTAINEQMPLEKALFDGRKALLSADKNQRDWHLPRLLLTQSSGEQLISNNSHKHRIENRIIADEFLDQAGQVKVASRKEFVGRRREIQQVLRAWRSDNQHSVLIYGAGNLGKSSIAARIAQRYPDHQRIVLFGKQQINPVQLVTQLNEHYQPKDGSTLAVKAKSQQPDLSAEQIDITVLLNYCLENEAEFKRPLLIILDDFEQLLSAAKPRHQITQAAVQNMLESLIKRLAAYQTQARLLITCRYQFQLDAQCQTQLAPINLTALNESQRLRQLQRYATVHQQSKVLAQSQAYHAQLLSLASGNPGLQTVLTRLAIASPQRLETLLTEVDNWLQQGTSPSNKDLQKHVKQLGLQALYDSLNQGQQSLLQSSSLFDYPLPESIMALITEPLALEINSASARLNVLGLWEQHKDNHSQQQVYQC